MSKMAGEANVHGKAARARCGASVREWYNQPSRLDGTRHGAMAAAMRRAGVARGVGTLRAVLGA